MCVSIANEKGAERYIAELLRSYGRPNDSIKYAIERWQHGRKWLLNYDLKTCQPKKPTGRPGMKRVRAALREVERTAQPAPKTATVTA